MLPWLLPLYHLFAARGIICSAFVLNAGRHGHCALTTRVERTATTTTTTQIQEKSNKDNGDESISRSTSLTTSDATTSRRHFGQKILVGFGSIAALVSSSSSSSPLPAFAAEDTLTQDKENIVKGYKRLNYLLDNWEKETSFCGTDIDPFTGKRKCERTPTIVMDYMGYKSIKDPLFKAEKTLRRLEELAPSNREADYIEAVEKWNAAADEANTMAYTSSWAGPQNPNGGDDNIEYFLGRAKLQVITARNVLKDVIDILGLKA
jgi:hypothetical protein